MVLVDQLVLVILLCQEDQTLPVDQLVLQVLEVLGIHSLQVLQGVQMILRFQESQRFQDCQ